MMREGLRAVWRSRAAWTMAALGVGALLGLLTPNLAKSLEWIAHAFIRLVQSIIAPLVIATLVAGVAEARDLRAFGKLAAKTLAYFFALTAIALCLGGLTGKLLQPGRMEGSTAVRLQSPPSVGAPPAAGFVDRLVPSSIVEAMADGNLLQIVLFSSLFAVACLLCGSAAGPVVSLAKAVIAVMLRYTDLVMYLAPFAVASAMASVVAVHGAGAIGSIVRLLFAFFGAQAALVLLVFVPIALVAGVRPLRFLAAIKEPAILAFSTASSVAALPSALRRLEEFGVPKHVAAFSVPLGMSFNLAGTCAYLGVAVVFCCQFAGEPVAARTELMMLGTLLITSKGLAGVPRSAMVALVAVLGAFGVSTAGIAVVLGADAVMDMTRTAVNLAGNCLAAAAIARWDCHEPGVFQAGSSPEAS